MNTGIPLGRWLNRWRRSGRLRPSRCLSRTLLQVEMLEPRCVPTLISLASLGGVTSGSNPEGPLLRDGGNLFGTAKSGGTHGDGTVFELTLHNGLSVVFTFANDSAGAGPSGSLFEDGNGNLFGADDAGGQPGGTGNGTIFELKAFSSAATRLVGFTGTNGASPLGGLIADSSGDLFGTTEAGGDSGDGTVFELPAGSTSLTTLAAFSGANGQNPYSGVALDRSGDLFGTTRFGGASGLGTVFEVQQGSGAITTLASFSGVNGSEPNADVIQDVSGNLFGTTSLGGAAYSGMNAGDGTVFEVQPGSGAVTTLASFSGFDNGNMPLGGLIADPFGNFFGTTSSGGSDNYGTVFELPQGSGTVTTIATFAGTNGVHPAASLVEDSVGNLYGTTSQGGTQFGGGLMGNGTLFEVQPPPTITTTSLANWTVNQPAYSQSISTFHGAGTITFSTTSGTLPSGLALSTNGVLSGTPSASGSSTFTVTATDSSGASGSYTYTVAINPPVTILTTTLASWTVNQPGYRQIVSSVGGTGSYGYTYSGNLPPGLMLSSSGDLTGTPTGSGSYAFTMTATDSVGASGAAHFGLTINLPITPSMMALATGAVSVAYSQTLSAVGGTGTLMFSVSPGALPPGLTLSSTGVISGTPTSAGRYFFTVTVMDTVGALGSQNYALTIGGVPVKLAFAAQTVTTPTGLTLPTVTVQVLDAYGNVVTTDNSDSVTVAVVSGPGGFAPGSTTTAPVHNGVASFSNLVLSVPGSYTLSEVVPTLYTGPNSVSFSVLPLQVMPTSFVSTPSGFSLQFNTAYLVNSLTPVLYGQGFGAAAPVPSVTLTQIKDGNGNPVSNPMAGSLVLDPANNRLTFVATDTALEVNNGSPVLPDGTYAAVVHGSAAANGFQALAPGGGFLDGRGTGTPGSGDYTQTFVVNVAATHEDIIWVPATADGPGQPIEAPGNNQVGGGFPVYLDSPGGVTDVMVTVNYNPALLKVTGATGTGFVYLLSSAPGHARFHYSGAALAAGSQTPIGFITAAVPAGTTGNPTPYRAKDLLTLSSIALNGSILGAVNGDALHLVAYVADADGNGSYSSNDAVLITRAAIQTDSGFAAYPLVDPVIVADTDGSGFIPADAALQANEAGVGYPTANLPSPPIPSGVHFQVVGNNVDPTLSIPDQLQVLPNGTVAVPVNIDDPHPLGSTGLIKGTVALRYDPARFAVSAADVHLGSVLAEGSGWTLASAINPTTGEIAISFSSTTPIASSAGGSLVVIDVHQIPGSSPAATAPGSLPPVALVDSVNPTGQQVVTTELEDAQGAFTLTLHKSTNKTGVFRLLLPYSR